MNMFSDGHNVIQNVLREGWKQETALNPGSGT